MAASSSFVGRFKYDVFLSFRGLDTRRSFVSHLDSALRCRSIITFVDSQDIQEGDRVSDLLEVIEESKISIVVLSRNYASSTWCLKELVKILDCMKWKDQVVLPIFYDVDPSDIRHIRGSVGEAFAKHEENPNLDKGELESWRSALTEVPSLSGRNSRSSEALGGDNKGYPSLGMARNIDDGYHWTKYRQIVFKGSKNPMSYYKCTHPNCQARKKEHRAFDGQIAEIMYNGAPHNHAQPQPNRQAAASLGSAFPFGEMSEMGEGNRSSLTDDHDSVWSKTQSGEDLKGGYDGRADGSERTTSASVLTEISDPLSSTQGKSMGIFESADTPEFSSALATVDDDDISLVDFAKAFAEHEENSDLDKRELRRWRSALTKVAGLSGWNSRSFEDDGKLIEAIVKDTCKHLFHRSFNGLVGMDSHIAEMKSRLCLHENNVRVVGIWGMGGLGKTTIARAVYEKIAWQFEHSCFLDNVKEFFMNKGATEIQEELLSRLLNEKLQNVGLNRGHNMIMERLVRKKVLVVLDDVETFDQIEALLGNLQAFGDGSRFIVTTRNEKSLSGVNETYKPMCLGHDEALELFMEHAFRTNRPNGKYHHLSWRALEYAQGLPLVLKVLGAFLDNKSESEWEAVLEKLKKFSDIEILDVLRTSFEELDDEEKEIFLDIACLFTDWDKDFVIMLVNSFGFFATTGLEVLVDRALITISEDDKLNMHDLLQAMGRDIVRLESNEPGKRSRLWSYEDVNHVLTQNTATDTVKCLMLDLSNSKINPCINAGAFVRMTKLRLLIIYYSFYPISDHRDYKYGTSLEDLCPVDGCKQLVVGDFEFLSHELRFLLWHGCPLMSLPSSFIPKNLVQLDMRGSHIQQLWEGIQPLQNLKVVLLSHCQFLVKIPDLTQAINLEELFLNDCTSLLEVHPSISVLQRLVILNLQGCKELKILPSSIHMKSLKTFDISGCSNVENFTEISDTMNELEWLDLHGTAIKELSSSINNLTSLVTLDLRGCQELKILPSSINMKSLETLNLSGCSNMEKFPEISEVMRELKELYLDGTAITELPSSISNLTGLLCLNMEDCTELKTLSTSIHMSFLRILNLDGCSNLEKLPVISGIMEELRELSLEGTAIEELPSSIDRLVGIKRLSMKNCKSLEFLPQSICNLAELTELDLSGCSKLQNLPEKFGDLESLHFFYIRDSGIKQLPFSILRLVKLSGDGLSCIGCKEMKAPLSAWPSSIEDYCSYSVLLHLDLSDCNLSELSDGIAHLSSLTTLKLCRNNLESLPVTMNQLGALTHLELEACKKLKSIPELSSSIIYIDAHDCTALGRVSMPMPPSLQTSHFFTFTNCLKLVQTNLFRDIVERHSDLQDNCLQPLRLKMSLPGSEIPDWFNCQSSGVSVSVHLPLNWFNSKFLGLAICAVCKYQGVHHYASPLSATCLCTFKGTSGECSFSFDLCDSVFRIDRFLLSDHMFLGYVLLSECHLMPEGKLVNETYTEATFQIVVKSEFITEQHSFTSCGVRFIYANQDEIQNVSIPHPQVHADGSKAGEFFMDPCELRNRNRKRRGSFTE